MSYLLSFFIFFIVCELIECEVYQDRPKIKSSNGDLVLQPAFDKNIYLVPNGLKSKIFVGELNVLQSEPTNDGKLFQPATYSNDYDTYIYGTDGILQRLEKLENHTTLTPNNYLINITSLWRKVNILSRKVLNLQGQIINRRGRDECRSQPCKHGGTCLNLVGGYHCICPSNWEGNDCDVDVNECRDFVDTDLGCQNGATCINRPGTYECLCRPGWFGLHCTRKAKDCSGGDLEMCGHGTCIPISTGEGITCVCHQGWTTNGTGVACSTDVNECESLESPHCSVNPKVECINLPGSFSCGRCPRGYDGNGHVCFDIDECVTLPNGGCNPLVACHNTVGSRICGECPPGYQGDGIMCTWRGPCNINHGGCHPSAQCVDMFLGGQTQCICPEGMNGDGLGLHGCFVSTADNFTTLPCQNNPCGVHGQCHQLQNGYTCICFKGYSGAHCDIPSDSCAGRPCYNGGICRPDETLTRGFRCECTAQYLGTLCEIPSKACGGVLDAEEGSIAYPLSNSTYNHNSRCAWVIHTTPDKVINVTFTKFNLENNPDCLYDFLQIHDGRSSANQFIGRFCGNNFPKGGNIISSHNNLYFWFRSDGSVAKDGFVLHWTSIKPICGGEVNATLHGHISSPGSPGKYPPNRDCYWHLATILGKRIQLHFFELDIETHANCSFDYLAIYDGEHTTDPLINMFCNSTQPAPIQSAGSDIMIHFHSDAFGSGNGFQIAYSPIEGIPGCGGYFTADRGDIRSPTFKGIYLNNLLCEYKIKTSPYTKIQIQFKSFKLERSLRCKFDYLKIYDGSSQDSRLVGKFCGTTYPKSYTSSSNSLFMKFKTDFSTSLAGFQITYTAICQIEIVGDSGVIKSPGYPFNYLANRVCEYIISTTPGKAIQLAFQDFDIEDNRYYNCRYNNIEIRDGPNINATLLGKYCGGSEHTPPLQTSTHNYMYIRFTSDVSVSGTGFYANYTTVNTECGGIYKKPTGLINHPSDDSTTYKNLQSCTWLIIAPEGQHIKITWNTFDLEDIQHCGSDYVELIEIDYNNNNSTLGKFCGKTRPPALTVSSNRLMLKFESDSSVISNGFSASYSFLDERTHCGATYIKTNGYIYSPGWPNRYEPNRDCVWIIIVPSGQQIRLNISQFQLEHPIGGKCNYGDYLEIRNGASASSPLLGQYCGIFQTRRITSLTNVIYLHFHSDSYISGKGFKIEWDGTITGCGGTLTSPSGSISSPNFPNNYNDNVECFYRVVTNLGSKIEISFTELDLELTRRCRDDYIEIYDGRDNNAASLGKICSMPTLNKIETSSNYAFIMFRSDFYLNGKGFLLNYNTICHTNISGLYGAIESPGYPNYFPINLNCIWQITVPRGNKINVTFSHFDVSRRRRYWNLFRFSPRTSLDICNNYLQYKETSDSQFSENLCGTSLPLPLNSKSNSLQIKFISTVTGYTGFRLEWVSYGCGGHILKRSGSLSFNKTSSDGELECEWLIETPIGTSVILTISDVYMKGSNECNTDALEIYNGISINSPLISKICQRGSKTLESTENYMLVKLIKRSTLKDVHFDARFISIKSTCGGYIDSVSGFIYSKSFPKNYDHNLDCIWRIQVPVNHRIELNFIKWDLYSSNEDDCRDSIKIYDKTYITSNYTKLLCPLSNTKQFISESNFITVQFVTDNFGTATGFKASFVAICGAVVKAAHDGLITNDQFDGHYNKSCIWTILAPKLDQKISLTIRHISLPRNNNMLTNSTCSSYLKIFDGIDNKAPLINELCGNKAPPMIVSHGSAITVELGTYADAIVGQFLAHYSALTTACGGELTSEEGMITSPNYPRAYAGDSDCEWILSTSPGNKVYVTFRSFDLEYSEACNEDYLEVRENDGGGRLIGVYCGNEIPTNATIASKVYIKFHSNENTNKLGFLIHYGFLHGNEITGLERGEVASPLFPFIYHGSADYAWRIFTDASYTITLTIDTIEIHSYSDVCYNKLVIYDGYDDSAPLLEELCGILTENLKIITTSSNVVYIKLKLDATNIGSKFHLRWSKSNLITPNTNDANEEINCGFNETRLVPAGEPIVISSTNYPDNYNDDQYCQWIFETTLGRHLSIKFNEFQIEETSGCFADSLSIYSASAYSQWQPIKENVCLFSSLNTVINTTNSMKITFRTDHSLTRKGFEAEIKSVCGGLITDLSGEVGPIWSDWYHAKNWASRCDWTIKVRPGRLIKLQFSHFNITNSADVCFTKAILRNGESIEAPFLSSGIYCGYSHENKVDLVTSSNSLFVSYIINNNRNAKLIKDFQSFKIHYEENNIECGDESTLDPDHSWEVIYSPNFPGVPLPYSECIWIFRGPPGEILRIDFIDRFDIDNVDDCITEVVEIRDGPSELSALKGRFCQDTPGTIKTSSNTVFIKYITKLAEPRNGFKANVSIDVCGGTIIADNGEMKSPGYPHLQYFPYPTLCEWHIVGTKGKVFRLTLQDLNLPDSESPCDTKVTIWQPILSNNTRMVLKTFCNDDEHSTYTIDTDTNEIYVTLHIGKPSEWSQISQSKGFYFTFNTSRPFCGGMVSIPEGILNTPSYPLETTLRYCQWLIVVPNPTKRVHLEIIDIDTGKQRLGIYNDITFQSPIETIQSDGLPLQTRDFESSGNKLAIYLSLQPSASRHRFKAKFSSEGQSLCGGELNNLNGALISPNLNRSYTCEWHYDNSAIIQTDADIQYNTIFVTIKMNASTSRSHCLYSDPKLRIKSTMILGSNFIRDICGNTNISYRIPSSSMDIKAHKSKIQSLIFSLEWKSQPCGGIVNVDFNQKNILNIPSSYNSSIDCAWVVVVPNNNRIKLEMKGAFDLDCSNEFLKVGQGISQNSPNVGANFCKNNMLQNPIITSFRYIYVEYHSQAKNNSSIKLIATTVKHLCGGYLTRYQKYFASPNYPKHYDSNQECAWEIVTDVGSRISLQFTNRFLVEEKPNCTKDAVILYDWKDNVYTEIARLCGRHKPPIYNSSYNQMKVVLRTDSEINLDGFSAQWKNICGGKYTATEKAQLLYSPNFPFGYSSDLSCSYEISAPNNDKLLFEVLVFELEGSYPTCENDNMTVKATSHYNDFIQVYCGNNAPTTMSNYNKIFLMFKTDSYINKRGFKFSYKIYNCGGKVKTETTLKSNELTTYDHNMNCTWFIEGPETKIIILEFHYIDLEANSDCYNDYVAVYDGENISKDARLALLCGHINTTSIITSTGNTLSLQFVTDSSLSFRGFEVDISFSYSKSVGCGGDIDLDVGSLETLKSPLLNGSVVYENFLDCHWTIKSPVDTVIKIEFISFHVSSCRDINQTALGYGKCDCDFVEVKDGINPNSLVIGTYCGHTLPPQLTSSNNWITIRLSTDGELVSSGFEVQLSVQQSICGQSVYTVTHNIQRIKSPGYDMGSIPRGLHCSYHLESIYRLVHVSIINIDLNPSIQKAGTSGCTKDKLMFTNNPIASNVTLGKDYVVNYDSDILFSTQYSDNINSRYLKKFEFCGMKQSIDLYFYGSITLNLLTSPNIESSNHKGVYIEISYAGSCGRNYTESQGRIYAGYLYHYREHFSNDCYTLITAPINHTISAYFITVTTNYDVDHTYLDIFDGNRTNSNKIVRINTDNALQNPVFSTGRHLLLHNHQNDGNSVYFDMNYVTTDKGRGCGGKLINEHGRVTSPFYPDIYRKKSTCEWELETPGGTRLKLLFKIFDLGKSCDQNYIQLVDSKGNIISSYCSEIPADYTSNDNFIKIVFITSMNNGGTGWLADFVGIL